MTRWLIPLALLCVAIPGCGGPAVDADATFAALREAMTEEIPPDDDGTILGRHNEVVVQAREGGIFEGLRRFEVEEKLGRGQECASRALCSDHGFGPTAWVYEIGRREGVAWGPTIIVGFDRQGIVDNVYTLTRD